ncbi:MAG: phosphomannomutase/phosphoglucomutase [Bdellovibrionales bacterium]|nr:phosphomannomutase/phosphoglucomutase [Bdellovibrionales bacterium]NQZ18889.1 phosphomannomutase/phosphoglucomutase [Bdellovibrionales bacterium]
MHKEHIFREYDIRGVYNTDFDNDFAHPLGKSYGAFLKDKTGKNPIVTVGYDARLSSPQIVDALIDGFTSTGAKVFNLGLITTPMSYFSMFHVEEVTGGIMVTGSHNPPDYNGFKISMGKTTIFGSQIQELKKYIDEGRCLNTKETMTDLNIKEDYVARYKKEFGQLKDIGVVLDCGNGAAGSIVRQLYNAVGIEPKIMFEEPDGRFPNHHPDPTVEKNVEDMKKEVIASGAKIGIGFDGDADRIGVVDHSGRFILGDEIMMIVCRDILKDTPGAKIVGDVKCSDRLYNDIEKLGGQPIMWKTGHSLIKTKIKEEKAPFGGELSGHIFFSDRNHGYDDAPYAGLRLIEILAKTGKTIDQLLEGIPQSFNTPEIRLETTEENKVTLVTKLQEHFRNTPGDYSVNYIDGVRVSYNDGWALVRSSNTQPVITIRFDSQSEEGLQRIQSSMMELVNPLL